MINPLIFLLALLCFCLLSVGLNYTGWINLGNVCYLWVVYCIIKPGMCAIKHTNTSKCIGVTSIRSGFLLQEAETEMLEEIAGQEDMMMKAGTEESRNNNCIEDFP